MIKQATQYSCTKIVLFLRLLNTATVCLPYQNSKKCVHDMSNPYQAVEPPGESYAVMSHILHFFLPKVIKAAELATCGLSACMTFPCRGLGTICKPEGCSLPELLTAASCTHPSLCLNRPAEPPTPQIGSMCCSLSPTSTWPLRRPVCIIE